MPSIADLKPVPKMAIITGGASGIGEAAALRLAKDGFDIAIIDLPRQSALAAAVVKKVEAAGRKAVFITADVTDPAVVTAAVDEATSKLGPVGVVLANAGIAPTYDLLEADKAKVDTLFGVNFFAVLWTMQAAARKMIEQGTKGRIIPACSICGLSGGYPKLGIYCATKHGVRALTQCLAMELADNGINVNAYAPGVTATPLGGGAADAWSKTNGTEGGGLGSMQQSTDVANLISFLAGPDSDYITGQTICTDRGGPLGPIVLH